MNAVDTNVFVCAFDADDPVKQAKAQQLLGRLRQTPTDTVLLWQVAGEFLNCLRRWETAGRVSGTDVETNFRDVLAMFPLILPTARVFQLSMNLFSRFSLQQWDSMLLAACKDAAIDILYTEDLDPGTDYDGVTVVNPVA
ncbi:MAG: PIN domain-containing protein [Planctomycetes bacterium]|nr:PIN domain-containing protein [Planctomycetota bacterium]